MITCTSTIVFALETLLQDFGLSVRLLAAGTAIPGSFWGEPEAGLVRNTLYVRSDTPLHSALHEAGHYLCMEEARRHNLHTDALSDDAEECAVCYLQILLAVQIDGITAERIMADMDAWGYSFRLGSTQAWFEDDALDARQWLIARNMIDPEGRIIGPRAN